MKGSLSFFLLLIPFLKFSFLPFWHRKLFISLRYRIPNIFDKQQFFSGV